MEGWLQFKNVVPIPLKDQIKQSDIWAADFAVNATKRYFIEAPSGKGKTTLQHIVFGLRQDYNGDLLVSNKSIREFSYDDWAAFRQTELSVVFQDLRLFPDLTAMENICLKNNLSNHKSEAEILQMATLLEVDTLLQQKCGQMSYGQRQRIAIIRALCQPFKFLLMDEPFAHLDSENVKRCCKLIMDEAKRQNAGYAIASLEEKYYLEYDNFIKI